VVEEVLYRRESCLVRRLILGPGEATPWHRDACQRVSVVLGGTALQIEYRDGGKPDRIDVSQGQVDWDMPAERIHRAVNVGSVRYEEVTTFFLAQPDAIPQPEAE
jgi:predicted metal-dependent enzyme (double-stranded beta helix superfamily)